MTVLRINNDKNDPWKDCNLMNCIDVPIDFLTDYMVGSDSLCDFWKCPKRHNCELSDSKELIK